MNILMNQHYNLLYIAVTGIHKMMRFFVRKRVG